MCPALLYAASSSAEPSTRYVNHVEVADDELPDGMECQERV